MPNEPWVIHLQFWDGKNPNPDLLCGAEKLTVPGRSNYYDIPGHLLDYELTDGQVWCEACLNDPKLPLYELALTELE